MVSMLRMRPIFRILMITLSVAGFVTQVSYVSSQYFLYATTTIVKFGVEESIFSESVSICFRAADILDYDSILKETGVNLTRVPRKASDAYYLFANLTIRQLFDFTPHEDSSVMQSCAIRKNGWQVQEGSGSECDHLFNISRYYTMEYICYQFREKVKREITDEMVDHSPLFRAKYNRLTLDSRFDNINVVEVIMNDADLPYMSRDYSYPLPYFKSRHSVQKYEYNFVLAAAAYLYISFMPAPYDTNCIPVNYLIYFTCLKECLLTEYEPFDAIPATELWRERFDKKAFIVTSGTSDDIVTQLTNIHGRCKDKCAFTPCDWYISKTIATAVKDDADSAFGFTAMTANDPDIIVTAKPTMTVIDFLTFIGSCIGTWFGLSFLSLDLNAIIRKTRRRRRQQLDASNVVKLFEPSPTGMGIHIYVPK